VRSLPTEEKFFPKELLREEDHSKKKQTKSVSIPKLHTYRLVVDQADISQPQHTLKKLQDIGGVKNGTTSLSSQEKQSNTYLRPVRLYLVKLTDE
jgi:hypothetical protein